jgi:mRNA interferase MazF
MGRGKKISQYEVFRVALDPIEGHEMGKTRPCVVISPDKINIYLQTVIVAPIDFDNETFSLKVKILLGGRSGMIALDHIRSVSKTRIKDYAGKLNASEIEAVKAVLFEMFC